MDEYNTLIICLSILCIILLAVILSKKPYIEGFYQASVPCPFLVEGENDLTFNQCSTRCKTESATLNDTQKNDCNDTTSPTGCMKKCSTKYNKPCVSPNGDTECKPNYYDISGNTKQQCIDRCAATTCGNGECTNYKRKIGRATKTGTFTNKLEDIDKCFDNDKDYQYCGPCVKACHECNSPELCSWLIQTTPDQIREFLADPFVLGVMPKNKSAMLIWNETRSDISKYLIFVYKKSDINVDNGNKQLTPLTVRTIERTSHQIGTNTHIINGLTNGTTYSISINKVSTHVEAGTTNGVIKSSNTIDIVPSVVNMVNFSSLNRDNTLTQSKLQSQHFMDSIKGKTFDITL
jgi:hypothetical protein